MTESTGFSPEFPGQNPADPDGPPLAEPSETLDAPPLPAADVPAPEPAGPVEGVPQPPAAPAEVHPDHAEVVAHDAEVVAKDAVDVAEVAAPFIPDVGVAGWLRDILLNFHQRLKNAGH